MPMELMGDISDEILDDLEDDNLDSISDELLLDAIESGSLNDYLRLDDDTLEGLGASRKAKLRGAARRTMRAKNLLRKSKKKGLSARQYVNQRKQRRMQRALQACGQSGVGFSNQGLIVAPPEGCAGLVAIRQPLYDTEKWDTGITSDVTFFATGIGSTSNVSSTAVTKSESQTNMTASRSLPNPQMFDLFGISWAAPTSNVTDMVNLSNNVVLQVYMGSVPWANIPLDICPQYSPIHAAYDGTQGSLHKAWTISPEPYFDLMAITPNGGKRPYRITKQETFYVKAKIKAAITLSATQDIKIFLHGILYRELR